MSTELDSKIPDGPLEQKWDKFKLDAKLIAPNNKRKYDDPRSSARAWRARRRRRRWPSRATT